MRFQNSGLVFAGYSLRHRSYRSFEGHRIDAIVVNWLWRIAESHEEYDLNLHAILLTCPICFEAESDQVAYLTQIRQELPQTLNKMNETSAMHSQDN